MKSSLIIHGHFYQPPRENPWTETLDREPSAMPHHDWNERIYDDCYRANAYCRVLDGFGRIERIVDNYSLISFNFGPTLLSWMERQHPTTYHRILESDRHSALKNGGHGNAIAQGYNHAILPLMDQRDRRTQIRWGLADFCHRFGREPESMWLPETACNDATLEALVEAGLKYVILSPHQAARARPIGAENWTDVSSGDIDPSMPYLWRHPNGSGRSIAIFFYQGGLAQSIAFEGGLFSSQSLIEHIQRHASGPLIHVATDGETYGHHVRYGDRTLAYALGVEAARHDFSVTNYGAFLEQHPPESEVEIKPGADGLGTAWSCSHGVGRWYRDCGCSTSGREGWRQEWRTPLRKALDLVRDRGATVYRDQAGELLKDPDAARDAYVNVILDRREGTNPFFAAHAKRALSDDQRSRALTLLELQRDSQLMYTSCGWFFAEISGLEAVQVMKYAGRAIDLLAELDSPRHRDDFLAVLAEAKSNLPEMGTGADIFRRFVDPCQVSAHGVAAHRGIATLVEEQPELEGEVGGWRFEMQNVRTEQHGRITLSSARIELRSLTTERKADCALAALHLGGADFYCAVRPFQAETFAEQNQRLWGMFRTASLPTLLRAAQEGFGPDEFGLERILPDSRERISSQVFRGLVKRFADVYAALYEENRRTIEMLQQAGLEIPAELKAAAEFTLGRRFEEEILQQHQSTDPAAYKKAIEIAEEVAHGGYQIDRTLSRRIFSALITEAVYKALSESQGDHLGSAIELIELTQRLRVDADLTKAQEAIYERCAEIGKESPIRRLVGPLQLAPSVLSRS